VKAEGRPQAARDPNIPNLKVARGCGRDEVSLRRALRQRFGPPSDFALSAPELAAHIEDLRRAGWLAWEIHIRFGRRVA
jgi:hypothetical protein